MDATSATHSRWSSAWLAVRSVAWVVLLPGVVAGYVPWRFFGVGRARVDVARPDHVIALVCIAVGAALLGICVFEFARSGRGTLSPLDPPRRLVVRGLYRLVRNPMYLSVAAIVLGEALLTGSRALAAYWVVWFGAVNLFVIGYEEPALRAQFGREYDEYTRRVGRWLPRRGRSADRRTPTEGP
jgi:protein-S-isoprenylcysteine O-methyltransferase Ste14